VARDPRGAPDSHRGADLRELGGVDVVLAGVDSQVAAEVDVVADLQSRAAVEETRVPDRAVLAGDDALGRVELRAAWTLDVDGKVRPARR